MKGSNPEQARSRASQSAVSMTSWVPSAWKAWWCTSRIREVWPVRSSIVPSSMKCMASSKSMVPRTMPCSDCIDVRMRR